MAADRKEPTISSIVPERDEIATHQQRMGSKSAHTHQTQGKADKAYPERSPTAAPVARGALLISFTLLLALAGIGLGGFLYWQLTLSQQQLVQSEQRIAVLEKRLELSDDESSQSLTAIRAKLKWADSEIRKLWGVSYDTNRKAIESMQKELAGLQKTLISTIASTRNIQTLAKTHKTQIESIKKRNTERDQRVEKSLATIEIQQQQLKSLSDTTNSVVNLTDKLELKLNKLQLDLLARVKSNEEALAAIDAYRRNINRDILQLQRQLQQKPVVTP